MCGIFREIQKIKIESQSGKWQRNNVEMDYNFHIAFRVHKLTAEDKNITYFGTWPTCELELVFSVVVCIHTENVQLNIVVVVEIRLRKYI